MRPLRAGRSLGLQGPHIAAQPPQHHQGRCCQHRADDEKCRPADAFGEHPGQRADLLLAELTTAEKCHQLTARMPWSVINSDGSAAAGAELVLRNPPGHIAQLIMDDAAALAAKVGVIQG